LSGFLLTSGGAAQEPNRAFLDRLLATHRPSSREFQFGLIGDQGYNPDQNARFPAVIQAMNAQPLAFVAHDGDLKGGGTCSDEFYTRRLELLETSVHPMIYTPGDNDWTDCHSQGNGSFDPLERLAALRRIFYRTPSSSLGRDKLTLTTQADHAGYELYRENALWTVGDVVFATMHVVGSDDGLGRDAAGDRDSRERTRAAVHWMRTAFALAREGGFRGVVLVSQANPQWDMRLDDDDRVAFRDLLVALEEQVKSFGGPVLYVHGDTHYFRIDKPLPLPPRSSTIPRLMNFTRLETFGPPDVHWVRVRVVPSDPALFLIEPQLLTS
jgi:hypothetical protein